jgi:hypothetical protein
MSGTTSEPSGPVIIQLGANSTQIDRTAQLIISALVTDPDGIDDVIGGVLIDPESGGTYGALSTAATEGAYSIALTWEAIRQVREIDGPAGGQARTFRAEFSDMAAHIATRNLSVQLVCNTDPALHLCAGACSNLNEGLHCGSCARACDNRGEGCAPDGCCSAGACTPFWGRCVTQDDGFANCAEACANTGESCVSAGCSPGRYTSLHWNTAAACMTFGSGQQGLAPACDAPFTWTLPAKRCCCTDTR